MTAAASWSSMRASRRCSSVAYSWRRALASASARCRACSRLREKEGNCGSDRLFLFHDALQRVLVLAREIHHLCHLRLGDLVGVDAALADAVRVDVQHDAGRILLVLVEEADEDMNNELHRRVVVIEQ